MALSSKKHQKDFLVSKVPELLKQLKADALARFGLMTPQHMVEHLTWVTKSMLKRVGDKNGKGIIPITAFHKFISNGAVFEYRDKGKTKATLNELKYHDLEEAKLHLLESIQRFYNTFEKNLEYKSYNPTTGELDFEQLELFNYQHFRWHFYQFHLLDNYDNKKEENNTFAKSNLKNNLMNTQVRLKERPMGMTNASTWEITKKEIPTPREGQFLVKIDYISLDPAMRGWVNEGKSYIAPVKIGAVMRAGSIGKVIESKNPKYKQGDVVVGTLGVQQYALTDGTGCYKTETFGLPLEKFLGVLGMPGFTAYFEIGRAHV